MTMSQAAASQRLRLVSREPAPAVGGHRAAARHSAADRPALDGQIVEDRDWHAMAVDAFKEVALAASRDAMTLTDLLKLVGRRLCELVGVSRCSVYLRRADGRFQGQVGYNAGRASIDARVSRLVSGIDSFTSEIVKSGAPVVVHDAPKNPLTVQRTMRRWRVKDMLGVPLVVDGEVIGIVYVDDPARPHEFSERDVRMAETFAGLCALAVKQTWQRERLLQQARAAEHERRVLARVTEVRSTVTAALAGGAAVEDVLRMAADELRKPIVMYNQEFEPTARAVPEGTAALSVPPLSAERMEQPAMACLVAKLHAKPGSVTIRPTPDLRCRRRLARLTVGEETLGYVELYELGRPFGPADARVLEDLASVLALKLRQDQRYGTRETVGRKDYFADLLFGRREAPVLEARGPSFGVDAGRGHLVMVLPAPEEEAEDAHEVLAAFADGVAGRLRPTLRMVEKLSTPEELLVLFEVDGDIDRRSLRPLLQRAAEDEKAGTPVERVVFTDLCASLGEIPEAVRQATGVAELLGAYPHSAVSTAFAQDLEVLRLVSQGNKLKDAVRSSEQALSPLIEHDRATGGKLVETLRAFIECGAQYRSTAARLGVHENTVRYRLHRVSEISSIDPSSFLDLTRAQFAFQVAQLGLRDRSRGELAG